MSMDYTLWVGPYAKCVTPTKTVWKKVNTCSAEACRFRRNQESVGKGTNFCPKCGAKAEVIKVETEREEAEVRVEDVRDLLEDRLSLYDAEYGDEGKPLWVPNRCNSALPASARNIDTKYDRQTGEVMPPVHGTTVTNDKLWFEDEFDDALRILRKAYGEANVSVCWGVLGQIQ
jgi:uncharacterized Zn finger protein (UPF0148 family)